MGKFKKIKKIRLHHEGTATLLLGFVALIIINTCAYFCLQLSWFFYFILVITLVLYGYIINFFRCPIRIFEGDTEKTVVAPADGKVVVVEEVTEHEYFGGERKKMISIFMSVTNVHANWFPVEGIIKKVSHQNGKFHKAWLPKASTDNERSAVVIETPQGEEVLVRQVAGAMARRIVTYAQPGDCCFIDEHLGFIKFGSRVDVYLPIQTEVKVKLGDVTIGNTTVIAKMQ